MKRRSGSGDCAIKPTESSKKCKEETCLHIEKTEYTEKKLMLLEPCEPVYLHPQFTQKDPT